MKQYNVNEAAEYLDGWRQLSEKLSGYGGVWEDTDYDGAVSNLMPLTALLGNGDLGIVSSGSTRGKDYLICKGDFWNCGDLKTDCVKTADPRRVSPIAAGGISVRKIPSGANAYGSAVSDERLDIASGILATRMNYDGQTLLLNAWVSQDSNLLIVEVVNEGADKVKLEAVVWAHWEVPQFPTGSGVCGSQIWCSRKSNNEAKDSVKSWTSQIWIQTKLLGADGFAKQIDNHQAELVFTLPVNGRAYLITAVGGGGRTFNSQNMLLGEHPRNQAGNLLEKIDTAEKINEECERSKQWWKRYWMKSHIEIGDDLIQKYYYGSLYYMGAGTREDKLPPGLYGIWTTTDQAMWNGDYHLNYNMIAPFYGMYSSNRCEFAKELKQPLLDYMEEGRRRAKEELSLIYPAYISGGQGTEEAGVTFPGREDLKQGIEEGLLYPVALGPWGSTTWGLDGAYLMQMYNAGFTGMGLTAYYTYTQDGDYFKEVYPFLEANANFFERWCEKEMLGEEVYRYNVWSGAHERTFDKNAATALGVIKNILNCLLQAVENEHIFPLKSKVKRWKDLNDHLADIYMEPWSDGYGFDKPVIPLSEQGEKYRWEQAAVNLEFIHPGELLTFDSEPALLTAARNTVEQKELVNKNIWQQINNTPKMYIHAIRAGYPPQHVMDEFKVYLKNMKQNFSVYDGYHGIEKAGAIEFINNMLLQSSGGILKVFPVWTGTDAEFVRLREKGAYLVSAKTKNGKVTYIEIISETGKPVSVVSPWKEVTVSGPGGASVDIQYGSTVHTQEKTVFFEAKAGVQYRITEK